MPGQGPSPPSCVAFRLVAGSFERRRHRGWREELPPVPLLTAPLAVNCQPSAGPDAQPPVPPLRFRNRRQRHPTSLGDRGWSQEPLAAPDRYDHETPRLQACCAEPRALPPSRVVPLPGLHLSRDERMVQLGAEFLDGRLSMDKLAFRIVPGGVRPDDLACRFHRIVRRGYRRVRVGGSAKCHGVCFHRWVIILSADRIAKVDTRYPSTGPRGGDAGTRRRRPA